MEILVTGSEGFVGKLLVKRLSDMGHEVSGFDISKGGDVLDAAAVENAVKGVRAVYHLAAVLDEKAENLWDVNVSGTKNLLEAAAKAGVEKFIHLSTVGVMGDISGKADESFPYNPKTPYEKSKAEAERLVLSYQEILPVVVVRSAFVYGPNRYWGEIVKKIREGFPLIGSGENTWQMVYVKDLVSALVFLMRKDEALGEIYIVAELEGMKLAEVYRMIAKMAGVEFSGRSVSPGIAKIAARLKSAFRGGSGIATSAHIDRIVRERNYDTGKINSLGWKPAYATEAGMRETIEDLMNRGEI